MTGPESRDEHLIRLIDTAPLGLLSTEVGGTIRTINTTLLVWLGYSRDDVVGERTFQQLLSPGGRIYFDTHVRPVMHVEGELHEVAFELVRADRTRLAVLVNFQRRVVGDDETIEVVVFDATERRRYETELLKERRVAEQTSVQLKMMYDVVSGLATAATAEDVVDVVTERGIASTVGARCAIWLFEPNELSAVRISVEAAELPSRVEFADGGAALDRLRLGQLVVVEDSDDGDTYPLLTGWLQRSGRRSAVIAPIFTDDELRGVLGYTVEELHTFDESERQSVLALAAQTGQALARVSALDAERQSRDRLEKLFRFSVVLSQMTTVDAVLDSIVDSSLSMLGAAGARLCFIDPADESVRFDRCVGVAEVLSSVSPFDPTTAASEVLRTGEAVVTLSREEHMERFPDSPLLKTEGFTRVIASPLMTAGGLSGVWSLILDDVALVEDDDTKLVQLFMEQAGHALSRAIALAEEVAARGHADARRHLSESLNRALTTADIGAALIVDGSMPFEADGLALFVVEGDELTPVAHAGLGVDIPNAVTHSSIWSPEERRFRHSQPVYLDGPEALGDDVGDLVDPAVWGSAAVVPLHRDGAALGLILALFHEEGTMGPGDREALWSLAAEAAAALARARIYEIDHEVADTLQRSLLAPLPDVSGWRIDSAYEPGTGELIVGGDLYDVTSFPDGRLVVIVGDVVGHGLQSAAAMGQLRSAARALALVATSPNELLTTLDEFARLTPGVLYSSVCCVMLAADGTGVYACAGHPFPVLVSADGRTTVLDQGRSPLLGVGEQPRSAAAVDIEHGATLVLYTDGLIERRGTSLDDNLDRLRGDLTRIDFLDAESCARRLIDLMPAVEASHDDVVVVSVTRTG